MTKGRLLVVEGVDGAGKTTQIKLLSKKLSVEKIPFEVISFPQYGKNKYADKVYAYLSGKWGKLGEVDPHIIAKLYASDRKSVRDLITMWLKQGKLVIANRYISSSKAHLGANLEEDKRKKFLSWIDNLEYLENGMQKEDLTILLTVDPKIGQKNSQVKDHPDLHEDNLKHLKEANKIFLQLAETNANWYIVDCMSGGVMKTPEEINKDLMKILENLHAI